MMAMGKRERGGCEVEAMKLDDVAMDSGWLADIGRCGDLA